jgi:hypothetical protein
VGDKLGFFMLLVSVRPQHPAIIKIKEKDRHEHPEEIAEGLKRKGSDLSFCICWPRAVTVASLLAKAWHRLMMKSTVEIWLSRPLITMVANLCAYLHGRCVPADKWPPVHSSAILAPPT